MSRPSLLPAPEIFAQLEVLAKITLAEVRPKSALGTTRSYMLGHAVDEAQSVREQHGFVFQVTTPKQVELEGAGGSPARQAEVRDELRCTQTWCRS